MTKNENGFTLIELLVVLGLSSIIISLIMSFFIININNYKNISNDSELQFQSQYILNYMSSKIMESSNIELIKDGGTISHLYHSGEQKITKISFRYGVNLNQCYNFEVKNLNRIYYGNNLPTDALTVELGYYVKEIRVSPIPETTIFKNAKAVKIRLFLVKNAQQYEAEQTVYMRN